MTNYEAAKADLLQYTASKASIQKRMLDAGIDPDGTYSVASKRDIAKVVIDILRGLLSLSSESEGGFSQSYNRKGLEDYIKSYANENDLAELVSDLSDNYNVSDKSSIW